MGLVKGHWACNISSNGSGDQANVSTKPLNYTLTRSFLCDADIIGALQVEPELRARAEPVPNAQGSVAGDATSTTNDLRHAIGLDVDLARKLGRRDAELGQFVGEISPGWMAGRGRSNSSQWVSTSRHLGCPLSPRPASPRSTSVPKQSSWGFGVFRGIGNPGLGEREQENCTELVMVS